jgi:hypothetical protein
MIPLVSATVISFNNLRDSIDLTEISSEEEKRSEEESEEREEVDGPEIFFLNENLVNMVIIPCGLEYFTISKYFPVIAPEVELEPPESEIYKA